MDKSREHDYLEAFGKHVLEIRKSKNLSLRQVAQLCDIDHSDIGKIEKGLKDCRLLTIVELAKGLEVTPATLLDF